MAALSSLPNHTLFPISPSIKPSKTLKPKSPPSLQPHHRAPASPKFATSGGLSIPLIVTHPSRRRLSVRRYLCPPDSSPTTTNNEEGNHDSNRATTPGAESKPVSDLMSLAKAYKEAILSTDRKTMKEIEAKMSIIEGEKEELILKISALSAEINSGKEKYVRLQADFDNFRKRSEKERLNVRSDAQGEVMESLLPMIDSFERAKQQLKPETEMEKKIDASYQGIYKQFVEIMRSLKVSVVPTIGKPFDPSLHEAISREDSQVYKEGIVIQEFRRGFLLGERLLRPAMVKVSAGPGRKEASNGAQKAPGQPAAAAGVDGQ